MVGFHFILNVVRRETWFRYRVHRVWPWWGAQSMVRFTGSESQCWKVVTVSVGSKWSIICSFHSIASHFSNWGDQQNLLYINSFCEGAHYELLRVVWGAIVRDDVLDYVVIRRAMSKTFEWKSVTLIFITPPLPPPIPFRPVATNSFLYTFGRSEGFGKSPASLSWFHASFWSIRSIEWFSRIAWLVERMELMPAARTTNPDHLEILAKEYFRPQLGVLPHYMSHHQCAIDHHHTSLVWDVYNYRGLDTA